jgi:hypothetical protein
MSDLIRQIQGYSKLIKDFESHKLTDFERARYRYCLKASDKLLKELASGITNDVCQPMSSITMTIIMICEF